LGESGSVRIIAKLLVPEGIEVQDREEKYFFPEQFIAQASSHHLKIQYFLIVGYWYEVLIFLSLDVQPAI
jgi:hypothetical protein